MFATFLNSWRQRSSLPWYSFTAHLKRNVSALSYSGKVKLFQRLSGEEKFSWIAEEAPGWDHTWATAGGWELSCFSIQHPSHLSARRAGPECTVRAIPGSLSHTGEICKITCAHTCLRMFQSGGQIVDGRRWLQLRRLSADETGSLTLHLKLIFYRNTQVSSLNQDEKLQPAETFYTFS